MRRVSASLLAVGVALLMATFAFAHQQRFHAAPRVRGIGVAPPTFTPRGGTYSATQPVAISDSTAGALIYYTTDGSRPTTGSSQYNGPIEVATTTIINAIAIATGSFTSAVATTTYTISAVSLPQIGTTALPPGAVDLVYSAGLTATSGVAPYTWSMTSGQLAPGLSLQVSTGQIVGTPSQAGTFSLRVQVKDSSNQTATANFSINIATTTSPTVTASNPASASSHYLYAISPGPVVTVYDMDNSFKQIKQISTGTSTKEIRGAVASAVGNFLYVSYGCTSPSACIPYLMKYDLETDTVVWNNTFPAGIDSHSISPDGSTIYMPTGEGDHDHSLWYKVDTFNGNVAGTIDSGVTGPHNTIVSNDGAHIYMGGIGQDTNGDGQNHVVRANATDGSIAGQIGPIRNNETRPFTIDPAERYVFVTAMGLNGFQVGSIATGDILYTASASGFDNSNCNQYVSCSHGISLSPDGKQIYVVDYYNNYVHVFDVSGLPNSAPTPIADIALNHPYTASGAWLTHSRDGRFVFVGQSGDVIDTTAQQIVGYIEALNGTKVYTEIDFQNGVVSFTPLSRSGVGYAN